MKLIFPGLYQLEQKSMVNIYALVSGKELTLIDTGMPGSENAIQSELESAGFSLADLRRIVLTHCHVDHAGSAAGLVKRSGAVVLAHRQEVPSIEGKTNFSYSTRWFAWLINLEEKFAPQPPCKVDQPLEDGQILPLGGDWQVIHTPGHTPGSLCLYQVERKLLFCGDTLFNKNPMTQKKRLQPPPSFLIWNRAEWEKSVRRIAALQCDVLCCGHGEPILEHGSEKIKDLIKV